MSTAVQPVEPARLLVLVNKSFGPSDIQQAMSLIRMQFDTDFKLPVFMMDSADWHRQQFARCGSWDQWIHTTVHGKDYSSRKPHFDGYVVCSPTLGKANAGIVRQALEASKAVLYWRKDKPLQSVSKLVVLNSNSWRDGWGVETLDIVGG